MMKPYPILLCLLLAACATQLGVRDQKTKRLTMFSQVVFAPDFDSRRTDRLAKWVTPLRIVIRGGDGAGHAGFIKAQAKSLASVTGLDISVVSEDKPANVTVYFARQNEMEAVAGSDIRNRQRILENVQSTGCHFYLDKDAGNRITRAVIFIRTTAQADTNVMVSKGDKVTESIGRIFSRNGDRSQRQFSVEACMTQELTHILGLSNNSDLIQPSIFNTTDYIKQPTSLDLKFIRALYSPALTPGMKRRDALIEVEKLL